jgi:hypothetical protein
MKYLMITLLLITTPALAEAPFTKWPNKFECTVYSGEEELKYGDVKMPDFYAGFQCVEEGCTADARKYICKETCHEETPK